MDYCPNWEISFISATKQGLSNYLLMSGIFKSFQTGYMSFVPNTRQHLYLTTFNDERGFDFDSLYGVSWV